MKKLLLIGTICAAAALIMGYRAHSKPSVEVFERYVVQAGDTLSGIARQYTPEAKDYRKLQNAIIRNNELKSVVIYPGDVLLIPLPE